MLYVLPAPIRREAAAHSPVGPPSVLHNKVPPQSILSSSAMRRSRAEGTPPVELRVDDPTLYITTSVCPFHSLSDSACVDEGFSLCGKGVAEIEPTSTAMNMVVEEMKCIMIFFSSNSTDRALKGGIKVIVCL